MGLVATFFTIRKQRGYVLTNYFGQFHHDWFIHNFIMEKYPNHKHVTGEFTSETEVSLANLIELHQAMCNKLHQECLDISLKEEDEMIKQNNLRCVKEVILYMKDNPDSIIFYESTL